MPSDFRAEFVPTEPGILLQKIIFPDPNDGFWA